MTRELNNKTKNNLYKELIILDKTTNLIEKDKCPHFFYLYSIKKLKNKIKLETDKIDGTLNELFQDTTLNEEAIENIIFQLLFSILSIQIHLKGVHHNLKPDNIYYKKIKPSLYEYIINKNKYYIKNYGIMIIIGNFESFESMIFTDDIEMITNQIRDNSDLTHLKPISKIFSSKNSIENIIYKNYKKYTNNKNYKIKKTFML